MKGRIVTRLWLLIVLGGSILPVHSSGQASAPGVLAPREQWIRPFGSMHCLDVDAASVWTEEGVAAPRYFRAAAMAERTFHRRQLFVVIMYLPVLLLVWFLFTYRTRALRKRIRELRKKEVAAREVLKQKNLLSYRYKNMEASLKYAQRIQAAMFTNAREIRDMFPSSFILQKPKDIVSGDFYWGRCIGSKIFLAVADCTGHGVPGAFMSLIGIECFRQAVSSRHVLTPAEVLDRLNVCFDELFGSDQDLSLKDGMDVSLCAFDTEDYVLEYAGAFNPLYIIRNNELIEIKGDKNNIGPYIGYERRPFTNHRVELDPDDIIYMFSDGYADQFGGPEGRKYKYRRFRHLLLSVHDQPMHAQKSALDKSIDDWKGKLEQVDDILVIGIRPGSLLQPQIQDSSSSLILETRSST
jgi:serine phosphatase RsbU (regulator of sigma subunit)